MRTRRISEPTRKRFREKEQVLHCYDHHHQPPPPALPPAAAAIWFATVNAWSIRLASRRFMQTVKVHLRDDKLSFPPPVSGEHGEPVVPRPTGVAVGTISQFSSMIYSARQFLPRTLAFCVLQMLSSFVDEFNRMLSDAIFEALIIDQGLEESHGRTRSRRAFEPAPPLFLPAPQLLEGIVQAMCCGRNAPCDMYCKCRWPSFPTAYLNRQS